MTESSDRFISIREVISAVGMCKAQVYKLVALGQFPKQVSISSRCVRWSQREIESWMEQKKMGCTS
ncbi:helix-turn-helix transcriptional regulator [Arsukibacterium ikkense]|uniref:helix-turn-helix transcriptional regulator n=1 Tax=Arsukibacterium ikkense TaxID=336831 RepID=UPI000A0061A7